MIRMMMKNWKGTDKHTGVKGLMGKKTKGQNDDQYDGRSG
jgi:hypothetical protein